MSTVMPPSLPAPPTISRRHEPPISPVQQHKLAAPPHPVARPIVAHPLSPTSIWWRKRGSSADRWWSLSADSAPIAAEI